MSIDGLAHEIWAAAQLMPGEGIADGAARVAQIIAPLRAAEATITKLRSALAGLVGADGKKDLEQMEIIIRLVDAPAKDKAVTIDAIHALMDTAQG